MQTRVVPLLFTLLFMVSLIANHSFAAIIIPQNLNQSQRIQLLENFGFGTISKPLTTPYSLGGYSGLELGMSMEYIDTTILDQIDVSVDHQDSLVFPSFSLGKGLYNNLDLFLDFVPFFEKTSISKFGALFRWGFYNSDTWPISLTLTLHANSVNISNKITTSSYGATLVTSFSFKEYSFYSGIGQTALKGKFIGDGSGTDNSGITDSRITEEEETSGFQWLAGASYTYQRFFLVIEINRFKESTYSAKIGARY